MTPQTTTRLLPVFPLLTLTILLFATSIGYSQTGPVAEVELSPAGLRFESLVPEGEIQKWLLRLAGPVNRALEFDSAPTLWLDSSGEGALPDGAYSFEVWAFARGEGADVGGDSVSDGHAVPLPGARPATGIFVIEGGAVRIPKLESDPVLGRRIAR